MADFLMPSLGADMETGTLVEWLVKPGDRVKPGDVVAVVETHKGAIDVEIFLDGVIDDLAPLGTRSCRSARVLARVRGAGEPRAAPRRRAAQAARPARRAVAPRRGPLRRQPAAAATRAKVSPARAPARGRARHRCRRAARHRRRRRGDARRCRARRLRAAAGAGHAGARRARRLRPGADAPGDRRGDGALEARDPALLPGRARSTCGRALDWLRGATTRERPRRPSGCCRRCCCSRPSALALREVPAAQRLLGGRRVPARRAAIHVGWAISLRGGGLVAPAIHDVDRQAAGRR